MQRGINIFLLILTPSVLAQSSSLSCLYRVFSTWPRPQTSIRNWPWTAQVSRSGSTCSCSALSTPTSRHYVREGFQPRCSCSFTQTSDIFLSHVLSLYLQVLSWLRLLLPFLPLHPQSRPAGEVPKRPGALPHQEDRL